MIRISGLQMPSEKLYQELESDYNRNMWILNILMLVLLDGGAVFVIHFQKEGVYTAFGADPE